MNLLMLVGYGLASVAVLSLWQVCVQWCRGEKPVLIPLRHGSEDPVVRWSMKAALQTVLFGLLLGYPALIGHDPIAYHRERILPAQWSMFGAAFGGTLLIFGAVLTIEVRAGYVRLSMLHNRSRTIKKLLRSCLTPIPLALMEEAIFRGIVLHQLLAVFSDTVAGQAVAIAVSAAIFSSVHFFRPQKATAFPAMGLFGLGYILGILYVAGGYSYWMPVAMHAAGILGIQWHRPFASYDGPAWLIGFRSYPIAGVLSLYGIAAACILLVNSLA